MADVAWSLVLVASLWFNAYMDGRKRERSGEIGCLWLFCTACAALALVLHGVTK